ncbi:hypothetical protein VTO42DRAFT_3381 [Malbranchea cinnamomea]
MARLNEVPASTESIESLKRRFVRQNREIARVNSIQSVRIRSLEADVSRLLAENVSLREEVISLSQELEKYQGNERIYTGIESIKQNLEAKLAEVSSLVTELGSLRQRCHKTVALRPPQGNTGPVASPSTIESLASARSIRELAGGLPVIPEDKSYPRSSLSSDGDVEPTDDREDGTDIQHHVAGPEGLEFSASSPATSASTPCETDDISAMYMPENPSNLEMRKRRKRRDSSLLKDIIPKSDLDTAEEKNSISPHTPKAGSKRKFSAREEDNHVSLDYESDDFHFVRVAERSTQVPQNLNLADDNVPPQPTPKKQTQPLQKDKTKTLRRVLGPKSTNVDLKSPAKKKTTEEKPGFIQREMQEKPKRITKTTITQSLLRLHEVEPSVVNIHSADDLQKHPQGAEDVFAGETAATAQPRVKELPPKIKRTFSPSEIEVSTNDQNQGTRRLPRRSRGAISYAEPNLRDKMRRPTEELVDAVVGEKYKHTLKYPTKEGRDLNTHDSSAMEGPDLEANVPNESKRNLLPVVENARPSAESVEHSASSRVISTLVAGTKKRTQSKRPSTTKSEGDFQGLPANEHDDERPSEILENVTNAQTLPRQSRRHSSNPSYHTTNSFRIEEDTPGCKDESQRYLEPGMDQVGGEGRRAKRPSTKRRTTMV